MHFDTLGLCEAIKTEGRYQRGVLGATGLFSKSHPVTMKLFPLRGQTHTHTGHAVWFSFKPPAVMNATSPWKTLELGLLIESLYHLYAGTSRDKSWTKILKSPNLPREVRFTFGMLVGGITRIAGKSQSFKKQQSPSMVPTKAPVLKKSRYRIDGQQPFRYPEWALESWDNFTYSVLRRASSGAPLDLIRLYLYAWSPTPQFLAHVRAEQSDAEYNARGYWKR